MSRKLTFDELLIKFNNKHNFEYGYDDFVYINGKTKGKIFCKKHGYFWQTPGNHLAGNRCPECFSNSKFSKKDELFKKFKNIHNDKFQYDFDSFKGINFKMKMKCVYHNFNFEQTPNSHLKGSCCPKCRYEKTANKNRNIRSEVILKFNDKYNFEYDYSKFEYTHYQTPGIMICKKHGEFMKSAASHLLGSSCNKCSLSSISKTESHLFNFILKYIDCNQSNRKIIKPYEIDIYIPDLKIGIEYNGLYWHSELYKENNYHLDKTELANSKGVSLIQIFEDEWITKQEIVESRLLNILGKTQNRIYARKCEIREISSKECRKFLDQNHIQGFVGGNVYLGLYQGDELVSLMTFGSLRKNLGQTSVEGSFELLRFCNKLNTTVIGGASKLFKHFVLNYNPEKIISYADRRWSEGELYLNLGFSFTGNSKPNYFYLDSSFSKREARFKYRKSELVRLGFDPLKTEKEIMLERNFNRIYDCGTLKFEWKKEQN